AAGQQRSLDAVAPQPDRERREYDEQDDFLPERGFCSKRGTQPRYGIASGAHDAADIRRALQEFATDAQTFVASALIQAIAYYTAWQLCDCRVFAVDLPGSEIPVVPVAVTRCGVGHERLLSVESIRV